MAREQLRSYCVETEEATYCILVFPPFLLANIEALLRRVMEMMEGVSLQASPSTCMGMVFVVIMRADLHWVMQVPWPPACSSGCNPVHIQTYIQVSQLDLQVSLQWSQQITLMDHPPLHLPSLPALLLLCPHSYTEMLDYLSYSVMWRAEAQGLGW